MSQKQRKQMIDPGHRELSISRQCHLLDISMDGRGQCRDNVFIERFWWTLKHHYLYLHSFNSGSDLRQGLT